MVRLRCGCDQETADEEELFAAGSIDGGVVVEGKKGTSKWGLFMSLPGSLQSARRLARENELHTALMPRELCARER